MNIHHTFNHSVCYYEVDGLKTYQKNQAISWARGDIKRIKFNFMDQAFDGMDLSKEPESSWSDLMRRRCQQLRNKYDILGLAYSGGFDSQTILDHFIHFGIKLDELHINTVINGDTPGGREAYAALDHAKQIKKHIWPDLKIHHHISDLNYVKHSLDHNPNWITDVPTIALSLGGWARHRTGWANSPSYQPMVANCRRGVVDGIEKPRLQIVDGDWCMFMPDSAVVVALGSYYENFYCTYDLPELFLKQHWMSMEWFENQGFKNISDLHIFLHNVQSYRLGDVINEQWNVAVGRTPTLGSVHCQLDIGTKVMFTGGLSCLETQHMKNNIGYSDKNWVDRFQNTLIDFILNHRDAFTEFTDPLKAEWRPIFSETKKLRPVRLKDQPTKINLDHLRSCDNQILPRFVNNAWLGPKIS